MNVEKLDSEAKAKKMMARFNALSYKRTAWDDLWEEVSRFIHPRRENMLDLESDGERTGKTRYNSHAVKNNQLHADGLQGNLISPSTEWFKLKFRQRGMDAIPFAKDWLEQCEEEIYGVFRGSNYYAATGEFLLDAGAICTACLFTEYDPEKDKIIFTTINPAEIYIAEDRSGIVNTVFREYYMTGEQMQDKFKNRVPDHVKEELDEYEPDTKHKVIHCILTRRLRDREKDDNKNMPYASIYIDAETEKIMYESGYEENPYLVLRYRKTSGETYGRGPGIDAMEEILRLNQFGKSQLKLAQLMGDPPMNIPARQKSKIRYTPGARNYMSANDAEPKAMAVAGNYVVGERAMDEIKQILDAFFHADFFMMLQRAERQMTAREVVERQGEKAAVIGSAIGRIYQEFLNPLIQRVFMILHRNGKIPTPPEELMKAGFKLDVELIGPLAMAQKFYSQTQGIQRGLEGAAPVISLFPEALDVLNGDEVMKVNLDASGMPQKCIREEHEIRQIREQRAAQQAQQQQMAQMQQMADAVPKLNQKVEQGSPLEAIDEQLAAGVSGGGVPA